MATVIGIVFVVVVVIAIVVCCVMCNTLNKNNDPAMAISDVYVAGPVPAMGKARGVDNPVYDGLP